MDGRVVFESGRRRLQNKGAPLGILGRNNLEKTVTEYECGRNPLLSVFMGMSNIHVVVKMSS